MNANCKLDKCRKTEYFSHKALLKCYISVDAYTYVLMLYYPSKVLGASQFQPVPNTRNKYPTLTLGFKPDLHVILAS